MNESRGCLTAVFEWIMSLFGFSRKRNTIRESTIPLDKRYREFVDSWVSERLAAWLHETRAEIDSELAAKVLLGEAARYPEIVRLLRETLLDAKVTFSQRDGKQYLEIEAYMAPRQLNGTQPNVLRWRAEREIDWQEIPDDVREQLIRLRQPITLGYSIPE